MGILQKIQGQILSTINAKKTTNVRGGSRIATPRAIFKGEFPELEGAYFDFSTGYRAEMYETSIRPMSGYVAMKYGNRDNIKMILNELKMPKL